MRLIGIGMYIIGMVGIMVNRRDIIKIIMSVELVLLGVTINMILTSVVLDDIVGEIFGIFILTVAAGESAIGLGILIAYFKIRGNIEMSKLNLLQG